MTDYSAKCNQFSVVNDPIANTLNRFKSSKDILWLGHQNETPPSAIEELMPRIQFGLIATSEKYLPKRNLKLVIVSAGLEPENYASLKESFLQLGKDTVKLLLVPEGLATLSAEMIQLQNDVGFHRILLKSSVNDIVHFIKSVAAAPPTDSLGLAKLDLERRVSRVRALVQFLKDLAGVTQIDDLMQVLMRELENLVHVKEPILVYATRQKKTRIYYFQGSQVFNRLLDIEWPEILLPRINDKKDSQFLADLFRRPFARVIAVPFSVHRTGADSDILTPGVIYFEHSLDDEERAEFIDFIHDRLHPMSVALDRIFLEKDLTAASLAWERTFDGISDPIAIFDRDKKLLHANHVYKTKIGFAEFATSEQDKVRFEDRLFEVHTYPISREGGDGATNFVAHFVDITMENFLQKQLIQQEKMAALGHLAGNIAHELNNPLTGIRALAQVLLTTLKPEDRRHSDLVEVELAAARCQSIIKNLLDFASGAGVREWVSLNDIVTNTMPFLKTLMRNYEIIKNLSESDVSVHVEPQLMQQVVFNLIKNACQAMGENGRLEITTRPIEANGIKYSEIVIADSGSGIPEHIQPHVFDFFFTTKKSGSGTGLGLSLSKNIVDSYGGDLFFESQSGVGTKFFIRLPAKGNKV